MDPVHFLPEGKHCYDVIDEYLAHEDEEIILPDSVDSLQNIDESQLKRIFLKAAEQGNEKLTDEMMKLNHELIKAQDSDGYTALHRASYNGKLEVIKTLIESGGDVLARTNDGWQPLHCACRWNELDAALLLLENHADINSQTNGGQTPLHLAATSEDNARLIEMLLVHPSINPKLKNNLNETALDIALRTGPHYKIFELVDESINIKK
eukprot:gene18855-20756_t